MSPFCVSVNSLVLAIKEIKVQFVLCTRDSNHQMSTALLITGLRNGICSSENIHCVMSNKLASEETDMLGQFSLKWLIRITVFKSIRHLGSDFQ